VEGANDWPLHNQLIQSFFVVPNLICFNYIESRITLNSECFEGFPLVFEHLIKRRFPESVTCLSILTAFISDVKELKSGQRFDIGWEFGDLIVGDNECGQVLEIGIFDQEFEAGVLNLIAAKVEIDYFAQIVEGQKLDLE